MNRVVAVVAVAAGLSLAWTGRTDPPAQPVDAGAGDVLVLRGRIIDGTGAPPVEEGEVVVRGGRIDCVGRAGDCPHPDGARVIDAGDGTILPGLVDLHVHARPHYVGAFLQAGVTAVRDLNNSFGMVDTLRAVPERPRLFVSGPLVDGPESVMAQFGAEFLAAGTADEARAAVDTVAARGLDVVKLYERLSPEAYRAAAAQARRRGLPVATDLGLQITRGLSGSAVDALQALEAGVSSIEHMSGFALAYHRMGGDLTEAPKAEYLDRLARAVVESGAAVVPTLVALRGYALDSLPEMSTLPFIEHAPDDFPAFWTQRHAMLEPVRPKAKSDYRLARALVRRIAELGGRIGAGTDMPGGPLTVPGGSLHMELELLVDAGLTPLQAIRAATGEAAAILGRSDVGVIAPGRLADLVVVDGNPAEDILATRRVRTMVLDGRVVLRRPEQSET